jgi:RHS repeat-associated protein
MHYPWYDGNGNVVGLMRGNGTVDATYRYTAFGGKAEATVNTSTFAVRNPYRFSTKYLDAEVETAEGTYYYGYRHYATALGRWTTKDPIGEEGGDALYRCNHNNSICLMDLFGMKPEHPDCCATEEQDAKEAKDDLEDAEKELDISTNAMQSNAKNLSWARLAMGSANLNSARAMRAAIGACAGPNMAIR